MSTGDAETKAEKLELDLWWSRRNLREHGIESASRDTVKTEPRNAAGRITMEAVVSRENMLLALRAVERNHGATAGASAAAVGADQGATLGRDLPAAPCTAGGHTQARRRDEDAGHTDGEFIKHLVQQPFGLVAV